MLFKMWKQFDMEPMTLTFDQTLRKSRVYNQIRTSLKMCGVFDKDFSNNEQKLFCLYPDLIDSCNLD